MRFMPSLERNIHSCRAEHMLTRYVQLRLLQVERRLPGVPCRNIFRFGGNFVHAVCLGAVLHGCRSLELHRLPSWLV